MDALRELRVGVADLLEGQPYLQVFASDACLRRFLVARRQNIEEAITSLRLVLTREPLRDCQTCWYPTLAKTPKGALQWEHPYHGCTYTAYPCVFTVTCPLSTNQQSSTQKTELPPALLPGCRLLPLQTHTFSLLLWPEQVYTGVETRSCAGGHHLAGRGARRRQRPNRGVHPSPLSKNLATPAQMACLHRLFHQSTSFQQISVFCRRPIPGRTGRKTPPRPKGDFWLLLRRKWSAPQPARRFPAAPPLFTQ